MLRRRGGGAYGQETNRVLEALSLNANILIRSISSSFMAMQRPCAMTSAATGGIGAYPASSVSRRHPQSPVFKRAFGYRPPSSRRLIRFSTKTLLCAIEPVHVSIGTCRNQTIQESSRTWLDPPEISPREHCFGFFGSDEVKKSNGGLTGT